MIRKFTRSIHKSSKLSQQVKPQFFSTAVTINSVTYVEQPETKENEFSEENFDAYSSNLPAFENATYQ